MKSFLIWQCCFSQTEEYNPSKGEVYLQAFEEASKELEKISREEKRQVEEEKIKTRQALEDRVFQIAKNCLAWKNPLDNSLIPLDGEIAWKRAIIHGPIVQYGSSQPDGSRKFLTSKDLQDTCPQKNKKIRNLERLLKADIGVIADNVESGQYRVSEAMVAKELLRVCPTGTLICQAEGCQAYRESSECRVLRLALVLR